MALKRSDPVLSLLARRRPELGNAHFGVNVLMAQSANGWQHAVVPDRVDAGTVSAAAVTASVQLGFSVPKRLLARAVDRNAMRRVAREAWRHADWKPGCKPVAAMVKLQRTDPGWRELSRPALKKVWRAEFDQLFAKLIANLGPGGVRRSASHGPRRPGSANPQAGNSTARSSSKGTTRGTNQGTTRSRKP